MAAVVEVDPEWSPNGHELGLNRVTRAWLPCLCVEGATVHRAWYCWTGGVTLCEPPHEP